MNQQDEFNLRAAQRQMQTLVAAKQRAVANLSQAQTEENEWAAAEEIGTIAELNRQIMNISELAQQEHNRLNPPAPPPQSREQWRVKPAEQMSGNDALEVINYGKKPGDPTYISPDEYNRGYAELQRLKSLGHYKE
jgi:hypothetical protein